MKIFVKVKPKSKIAKVEKIDDNNYIISVKEAPEKGRANDAVINLLTAHFKTLKNNINISCGHKCKNKIIEIKEN